MSKIIMLSKHAGGTIVMIDELLKDKEKSICFKHYTDYTHDCIKSGELTFPVTPVWNCSDILLCLEPEIETIGIENMDYFSYTDIVKFLKKLIRKNYKIIITGKNIVIDRFSV